jgi:hypothetical protein
VGEPEDEGDWEIALVWMLKKWNMIEDIGLIWLMVWNFLVSARILRRFV